MNPASKDRWQKSSQHRTKQQQEEKKKKKSSYLLVSVSDEPPEILPREEVAEFRHSVHHKVCVRLLQEGNHSSFSELVSLCEAHEEQRAAAKPASALSLQTPLEQQGHTLESIRLHLGRAEEAGRRGSWSEVCEQRLLLAQCFSAPVDQWLTLHFYHSCADRQQGGYSRAATEARACMAELYLQQGDLQQALHQAERCVLQAEEGGWLDSSGRRLSVRARLTLCDVYNHLAEDQLDAANYTEALELLHRSHGVTAETEDKQSQAEATYRLGVAYQHLGDHDRAKKFFSTCLQIYGTLQDTHGLVKGCKAMAKSLESEGNIDESILSLEKMADISESGGVQHSLVDALLQLGNICFTTHQYKRAADFFLRGYEVACDAADVSQLHKAQVLLGHARARCQIEEYMHDVVSAPHSTSAMHRLLARGGTGPGTLPDSTEPGEQH